MPRTLHLHWPALTSDAAAPQLRSAQHALGRISPLVYGSGTRIDTLRVEVQLSEAIPEQQQAHDNVLITRMNLAQAMGLDHTRLTYRYAGRDFRLTDVAGEVVKSILA